MFLALVLLAAGAIALPHPNSISSSSLVIEGGRVRHELLLQPEGLFEVLPGMDADGDGVLDPRELEARRADVGDYVARHHRMYASEAAPAALERRIESVELAPPPVPAPAGAPDWVRVLSSCDAGAPLDELVIEVRLFFLTSPDHRDFCSLRWDGVAAFETSFSQFEPRRSFHRADVDFTSSLGWLRSGAAELLFGVEHLAFLAVLLAGARDARSVLRALCGFTLARWLGFGVALADLDPFPPRFVELSVALSSAFLASQILLRRGARAGDAAVAAPSDASERALEAFVFGAVHGLELGRDALVATAALEPALGARVLVGVGIELGQLAVVALGLLLARMLRRGDRGERARSALAWIALVYGLYAFATRSGWI